MLVEYVFPDTLLLVIVLKNAAADVVVLRILQLSCTVCSCRSFVFTTDVTMVSFASITFVTRAVAKTGLVLIGYASEGIFVFPLGRSLVSLSCV